MGLLLSGKNPAAYKTAERTTFTATAGQTTFTVPVGYNIGDIDVYLNGIRLIEADDYYATNGTTVILTTAASAGDSLVVVCYYNFLNSSSYTKAEGDARYVGFGSTTPMTTYLRTPNYGVSSYSDSASASLEANPGLGTQGVGIKASGRSMATSGGELTYVTDTRGASGAHRFYGWNGTSLTNFGGFDSLGRLTVPATPAFHVGKNNGDVTSGNVMVFNSVYVNNGGYYSTSTGRFTAPVNGLYWFFARIINAAGTTFYTNAFTIRKNGGQIVAAHNKADSAYIENAAGMVINLNVGDYVDVLAGASMYGVAHEHSNFHGYLIG